MVEDATESLGAFYRGRRVGADGSSGCLSFNGNKIITCGGGGMVLTRHAEVAARVRALSTQARSDPLEWVHDEVGFNYRLTNLQAAIGRRSSSSWRTSSTASARRPSPMRRPSSAWTA
jgi:perosamine synthetase